MNKYKKALLSSALVTLLGCDLRTYVPCDNENNHVHEYVAGNGTRIWLWQETGKEVENYEFYYNRTDNMMNITSEDEKFYKFLKKKKLARLDVASNKNMNYLYSLLYRYANDTLEYYYYDSYRKFTPQFDDDGNFTGVKDELVEDYGYTPYKDHSHNTGKVRVIHHRFIVTKIEKENGEYKAINLVVDDPQNYWEEYPYFYYPNGTNSEPVVTTVKSEEIQREKEELPTLTAKDLNLFENVDTTTEGFQNWLNSNKSSFLNNEDIQESKIRLLHK